MSYQLKFAIAVALMMSFAMSLFFSGLFSYFAVGDTPAFLSAWGRSVALGWPLGFCVAMLIGVPVRMIAEKLVGHPDQR